MPSRKKGLAGSTEDGGRQCSSKNGGEENCKNSSVQGAAVFPVPVASNTSVHDLILPDVDLVNAVQLLALYLLRRACSKETDFSRILADWFGLGSNKVNVFLAKWFHKQHTAEVKRGPVERGAENALSASVGLLQSQLICDCARNQQDFCALFADQALCAQVLDEHGNVRTDATSLVENASKHEENSETNMFLRGLLETLRTKSSTVCPQLETPSVDDALNTIIHEHTTAVSAGEYLKHNRHCQFRALEIREPKRVFSSVQLRILGVLFSRKQMEFVSACGSADDADRRDHVVADPKRCFD